MRAHYSALLRYFLVAIALLPSQSLAANICDLVFDDADPNSIEKALNSLPPLGLDYSNYRKSMKSLVKSVGEVKQEWSKLVDIENQVVEGRLDKAAADVEIEAVRETIANQVSPLLKKSARTQKDREMLEAYKLLLKQTSRLRAASKADLEKKREDEKAAQKAAEKAAEKSAEKRVDHTSKDSIAPEPSNENKPGARDQDEATRDEKLKTSSFDKQFKPKKFEDPPRSPGKKPGGSDPKSKDAATKLNEQASEEQSPSGDKKSGTSDPKSNDHESKEQSQSPAKKPGASDSKSKDAATKLNEQASEEQSPSGDKKSGTSDPKSNDHESKEQSQSAAKKPGASDSKSKDAATKSNEQASKEQSESGDKKSGTSDPKSAEQGKPSDGKPADGKPGDGKPGDGKPGDGKPGDGKPGDGKPGDGKPGDGKPGEGKPGEGKPGDGKPGDGKPGDGKPGDGKPGDGKPGEGKPGEGKPGEGKPGEGKPGDGKPGEGKPGDGKPGDGKPGDGKPGDGKPGDGKSGDGKSGDGKQGDGKQGEGKQGEGKQGDGKPGEGKPGEGKPGEDKPGEGKPGEGKAGEGKPGEGKPTQADAKAENSPRKSDGIQRGGEAPSRVREASEVKPGESSREGASSSGDSDTGLGQKISEKMSEFFKDLVLKTEDAVAKRTADREVDRSQVDRYERELARENERREHMDTAHRRWSDLDDVVDSARRDQQNRRPEKLRQFDPFKKGKKERRELSRLGSMTSPQTYAVLKALVENAYSRILASYHQHDPFMLSLGQFKIALQTLYAENLEHHFLLESAELVEQLRVALDGTQVSYKNLEDIGLSLIAGGDGDLNRKLQFLEGILSERQKRHESNHHEDILLGMVRKMIRTFESKANATDVQLGSAFLAQLIGPLSRKHIMQHYASDDPRNPVDWARLASDIRNGQLNDLLIYTKLNPYLKLFLNTSMTPKNQKTPDGAPEPINEKPPGYELAQELDRFQYFLRDGSPTSVELMKFISGDMLETTFYTDRVRKDPKTLHPRKVSIVLYDVSDSMGDYSKYVVRNAILAAYLDQTQIEVAAGRSDHTVYFIAYDTVTKTPVIIRNYAEAVAVFEKFRSTPIRHNGGTSNTAAIVKAFELIAEEHAGSGGLDRANVQLVTDGDERLSFELIAKARALLSPDIDLRFNAITMGDFNSDIAKLVHDEAAMRPGRRSVTSHQHIAYNEVSNILNSRLLLQRLEEVAKFYGEDSGFGADKNVLMRLKNQLVMVQESASMNDQLAFVQKAHLIAKLRESNGDGQDGVFQNLLVMYFKLTNAGVSASWSKAMKIESFFAFIESSARELRQDPADLVEKITEGDAAKLIDWMGL